MIHRTPGRFAGLQNGVRYIKYLYVCIFNGHFNLQWGGGCRLEGEVGEGKACFLCRTDTPGVAVDPGFRAICMYLHIIFLVASNALEKGRA